MSAIQDTTLLDAVEALLRCRATASQQASPSDEDLQRAASRRGRLANKSDSPSPDPITVERLEGERDEARHRVKVLEAFLRARDEREMLLKARLAELRPEKLVAGGWIAPPEAAEMRQERDLLKARVAELERQSGLERADFEKAKDVYRQQRDETRQDNCSLKSRVAALEKEEDRLARELGEMNVARIQALSELAALKGKARELEGERDTARALVAHAVRRNHRTGICMACDEITAIIAALSPSPERAEGGQ